MGKKFYSAVWGLMRVYYDIVYPRKVYGFENIPASGPVVVIANHISARDPLFIASRFPRKRLIHFMAKKELFKNPILRKIMELLGAFPVDRGAADMSAIHTSLKYLKEGEVLGIFPQGTRSKDNSPIPMLSGASMIALRANAPIIPVYIDGPYHAFHRVDLHIGEPIDFSVFGRRCDRETLDQATKLMEKSVWGLKPQSK